MKRLELVFDDDAVRLIEELKFLTGARTNKDFFNNVITLYEWAVFQVITGRILVSLNEEKKEPKQLVMPALEHVGRLSRATKQTAIEKRSQEPSVSKAA
jgi:hypothetical protein